VAPFYPYTEYTEYDRQAATLYNNVSKADNSRTLLRYSITYHYDLISLSSSDANQKNSCMSLTALYYGTSEVRAFKWIQRQTADFIQDPHPRRNNMLSHK